jgi:hypothetical protein
MSETLESARWSFNRSINLGQVLVILSICGTLTGVYAAKETWCARTDSHLGLLDIQITEIKKLVEKQDTAILKLAENQNLVAQTLAVMKAVVAKGEKGE